MTAIPAALSIQFAPLVPLSALAGFALLCMALALTGFLSSKRKIPLWRILAALGFLTVLAGPVLVEETRTAASDVAVVVADRSASNAGADRKARTDAILDHLRGSFADLKGVDLRILETPPEGTRTRQTLLFDPLSALLSDVPESRRAGVILLTDGQIHDVPTNAETLKSFGPVHAILTGQRDERDRAVVLTHAPAYGVVGQSVTIRYRIEDHGRGLPDTASILIRRGTADPEMDLVPVGVEQTLTFPVSEAGQNILEIETPTPDGDIAPANNRVALLINGVRDRLRVLLVSGTPHAGERVWRDILTADPGVDLVHFTILRNPDMIDLTPQREMSLIAFPFEELFEKKLDGFDLIILDRYRQNDIMPDQYFANISDYVKKGGGLLISSGPEYAGPESLRNSSLRGILPGVPTGQVRETPFRPNVTDTGRRHPVTADLHPERGEHWGRWLRVLGLSDVETPENQILMRAGDEPRAAPLLILAHEGKGRIAHLASDQIWLWARGFDGGGPYADFMRRIIHWLMKEPELEENALDLTVEGQTLTLRRRSLDSTESAPVTLTGPDGKSRDVPLTPDSKGRAEARIPIDRTGVWRAESGSLRRIVIAGDPNAPEQKDIRAAPDRLAAITAASEGSLRWATDDPTPALRLMPAGRTQSGQSWIGLRRNNDHTVTGARIAPLLPLWLSLGGLLVLSLLAWWREGRRKTG
ncbi:MAG: hypothetical protein H6862_05230 [Rhodospirillales bacterium]|nr:hypothetical protein [Rhodospirillales bacterium]